MRRTPGANDATPAAEAERRTGFLAPASPLRSLSPHLRPKRARKQARERTTAGTSTMAKAKGAAGGEPGAGSGRGAVEACCLLLVCYLSLADDVNKSIEIQAALNKGCRSFLPCVIFGGFA